MRNQWLRRIPWIIALVLASCALPSEDPQSASGSWTQLGRIGGHSGWSAEGPVPPLRLDWRFEGDEVPLDLEELWGGPVPEKFAEQAPWLRLSFGSPAAVNATVMVGSDKAYGLDAEGELRWSVASGSEDLLLMVGPVVTGGVAAVVFEDSRGTHVIGIDVASGEELWRWSSPPLERSRSGVQIAAHEGHFLVTAGPSSGDNVWLLDDAGALVWSTRTGWAPYFLPSMGEGVAALMTSERGTSRVEVLSLEDGSTMWTHEEERRDFAGSLAISGERVLVGWGDEYGYCWIKVLGASTGELLGEIEEACSFVVDGDHVTFASECPEDVHPLRECLRQFSLETLDRAREINLPTRVQNIYWQAGVITIGDGILFAADVKPGRGEKHIHDELFYVSWDGGLLWNEDLPAYEVPWEFWAGDDVSGEPVALASTGEAILVTMGDGRLHAYVSDR